MHPSQNNVNKFNNYVKILMVLFMSLDYGTSSVYNNFLK